MFNTHYIDNSYRSPSKIEVTEKRAATDDSVRILSELEKAAMDKIVAMGRVDDNVFKSKWYIISDNMIWEDRARCIFSLNGKEYDFEFRLPGKFQVSTYQEYGEYMRGKLLEKLTQVFLEDLWINNEKSLLDCFKFRR